MKFFSEVDAENLLEKEEFKIVDRFFVKKEKEISDALSYVGLPCVMKVAGKKIVHKKKIGGVELKVDTYSDALNIFKGFKKIKGFQGAMFQKKLNFNKEFLLGIKKTDDFGHVLIFGAGGSRVEEEKDVGFRVCPLEDEDIFDLMEEVFITHDMGIKEKEKMAVVFRKICLLVKKYPGILEMDINPFVLAGNGPEVLDARILFE